MKRIFELTICFFIEAILVNHFVDTFLQVTDNNLAKSILQIGFLAFFMIGIPIIFFRMLTIENP